MEVKEQVTYSYWVLFGMISISLLRDDIISVCLSHFLLSIFKVLHTFSKEKNLYKTIKLIFLEFTLEINSSQNDCYGVIIFQNFLSD